MTTTDANTCPLGHENAADAEVCATCGQPLDAETPAEESAEAAVENDVMPNDDMSPGDLDAARSKDVTIVRGRVGQGVELRDAGSESGSLMYGYFSSYGDWYEISSFWEGDFLERMAPGAFDQTIARDRDSMRVLYDHGYDPVLGNKPLGPITVLRADNVGPYYEVALLDTDYNRDFVVPALEGRLLSGEKIGSQLGASMRFIVEEDAWVQKPDASAINPKGLPERSITRASVLEFGPVTFPANAGASAGVRSGTDDFIDHLHHDPRFVSRLTARVGEKVVARMLETMCSDRDMARNKRNVPRGKTQGRDPASEDLEQLQRRARVALACDSRGDPTWIPPK